MKFGAIFVISNITQINTPFTSDQLSCGLQKAEIRRYIVSFGGLWQDLFWLSTVSTIQISNTLAMCSIHMTRLILNFELVFFLMWELSVVVFSHGTLFEASVNSYTSFPTPTHNVNVKEFFPSFLTSFD